MTPHNQSHRAPHRASTAARRLLALGRVGCCVGLLLAGPAVAQTLFTDVTEEANLRLRDGQRAAFGDYDSLLAR